MSLGEFKKIIQNLPRIKELRLTGYGEPLLNPDFVEMVKYAKSRNIRVEFSTNATLLTQKTSEELVLSGADKVLVSLHSALPETYEKIMVGAKLEKVLENVRELAKIKREYGVKNPRIFFATILMKQNLKEVPQILNLASELGVDGVEFNNLIYDYPRKFIHPPPILRDYSLIGEDGKIRRFLLQLSRRSKVKVRLPGGMVPRKRIMCVWPWLFTYITSRGYVTPCPCVGDERDLTFGNLLDESFSSIWNNEGYRSFRARLLSTNPPDFCRRCAGGRGVTLSRSIFYNIYAEMRSLKAGRLDNF